MAELLSDELWGVIEPHLPKRKRRARRRGGRPPIPDRQALTGILFVLRHGLPWGARFVLCRSGTSVAVTTCGEDRESASDGQCSGDKPHRRESCR